jgi:hypothetical protein
MPDFLEFHDSTIVALSTDQLSLQIGMDAYVHRWQSVEGRWTGRGWVQSVRITVSAPTGLPQLELPATLASGSVELSGCTYGNLLPLPYQESGRVRVKLELATGEVIEVVGLDFAAQAAGEGRFVEDLPDEFRLDGLVAERLREFDTPRSASRDGSSKITVRHDELVAKAKFYAGEILGGKLTPYDGATRIWKECFQQTFDGDHTFDPFVYWQDEYEDAQSDERRLYCAGVIRQFAQELLGGPDVVLDGADLTPCINPSRRRDEERDHSRLRSRQIEDAIKQVLMHDWDPIGIADEPACGDEYDSYIGGIYHLLASGADDMQISSHLAAVQTEMMGLPQQPVFLIEVARRLREIDFSKE